MIDNDIPDPVGRCQTCGAYYWTEHDHRPIGTLTSEEAAAYWEERRA